MNKSLFIASLVLIISVLICLGSTVYGIRMIVIGRTRRVKATRVKGIIMILLGFVLGVIVFLPSMAYAYIEHTWFVYMGYKDVFWELVNAPWRLFARYSLMAGGFLALNFTIARRICPIPGGFSRWASGGTSTVHRIIIVAIIALSIIMGSFAIPMWDEYRRYYARETYTIKDPISGHEENLIDPQFGRDVGYYLFTMPIRSFSSLWTKFLFWINLIFIALLYNFYRGRDSQSKLHVLKRGSIHLLFLWILLLIVSLWRSKINIDRMVYSKNGFAFGAGYTDVHIRIPAYYIYMIIIVFIGLVVLLNMVWKKRYLVTVPVILWFSSYLILIWIVPFIYQTIKVSPNEGNMERPFIDRNIKYSRIGYDLDRIKVGKISPEIASLDRIKSHPDVLRNLQLWDRRTTRDTLNATQVFRPYYTFYDVDADRYNLVNSLDETSEYRQVMVSARELDSDKVQSKKWVTQKLVFTHGYGVCLGPVNQFTTEGKPFLWVEGIPPKITRPEIKITRPEIYYGEVPKSYVFVNTTQKEFDFPEMEGTDRAEDRYTTYEGTGGIPVEYLFRKIMLAIRFRDFRIIMSGHLRPNSRIMFHRQILDRIKNLAPFMLYDDDPYIVIGDSGQLWWIVDIFTMSSHFPYSEPYYKKFNYIRNPLKAVVNAYNGSVDFYIWDENEIITKVYKKAFPGLFKDRSQMPDGLDKHNRYPTDLATIQSEMYCLYHMQDPQTFYDKGDRWDLPFEIYYQPSSAGKELSPEEKAQKEEKSGLKNNGPYPVRPIYVMINIPGSDRAEFTSIMSFTPYPTTERQNMVAWMIIRNDEPKYGEIMVYIFPKGQTVSGPAQIESRIDTNPEISEKLTLWNDGGSQVIRGNLLTLPISNSIFYVEPLYLQADIAKMPLLTQVIVAAGDRVAWGENFDLAMSKVFEIGEKIETSVEPALQPESAQDVVANIKWMLDTYKNQLQSGDAAGAAKTLENITKAMNELEAQKKGS